MSMRELARQLGVSHGALGSWERGQVSAPPDRWPQIVDLCGGTDADLGALGGRRAFIRLELVELADDGRLLPGGVAEVAVDLRRGGRVDANRSHVRLIGLEVACRR
jgi:transcriptional regulator with XRE-family HTH domain